jgi:hypothetical protein
MKHLLWIPVCLVALAVPAVVLAGSGEGGFDSVVSSIESRYHQHATRIPFLGLASLVAHGATHGGVANLHVAEFDDFRTNVDGDDLNSLVEEKIGAGWQRVIRDTSRHGNEQSLIFMRPEGKRMGVFVLDLDGSELDVVQVSVDPDQLNNTVDKYSHHHDSDSASGDDKDSN